MSYPILPEAASDAVCASATILVIDDSATSRSAAEKVLREAGYRVVVAENGFEALAKIADCQPALIVCDIVMPRLDGYRTCALIDQGQCGASRHAGADAVVKGGLVRPRARRHGRRQRLPGQAAGARGAAGGRAAAPGQAF